MEFKSKYTNSSTSTKKVFSNSFYGYICKGVQEVQSEIEGLENRIDCMGDKAPKIFYRKINLLVELGNQILKVKECYEFNRKIED
jgi:archaellum component FlaC